MTPKTRTADRHKYTNQLRVSDDVAARLDDAAAARGVSRGWLANRLLTEALDRIKPPDEFRLTYDG